MLYAELGHFKWNFYSLKVQENNDVDFDTNF